MQGKEAAVERGGKRGRVDHISVLWFEPETPPGERRLAMFLHPIGGCKEDMVPYLRGLAAEGFYALSFDAWQHGERAREPREALVRRVFGSFRRHMWPIAGQTALDALRVVDWAADALGVGPRTAIGGLSMGGDIAVAAAGLDRRIERVAAVAATADWLRPGMEDERLGEPIPPGEPDRYAAFFYERMNPLTNIAAYAHGPLIRFICAADDRHVPPDGALRFRAALAEDAPAAASAVQVELVPGKRHADIRDSSWWWPAALTHLTGRAESAPTP